MAKISHNWYLGQWLSYYGKKPADMAKELDWNKAKINLTINGKQPYNRNDVEEVSAYLNVFPYELLMPPEDAMAMRRIKSDLALIANGGSVVDFPSAKKKFR